MFVKINATEFVNTSHVYRISFEKEDSAFIVMPDYQIECSAEAGAHLINIVNSENGEASGLGSAAVLPGETPRETEQGGTGFWRCSEERLRCVKCGFLRDFFNAYTDANPAHNIQPLTAPGLPSGSIACTGPFEAVICGSAVPDNLANCDFCGAPKPTVRYGGGRVEPLAENPLDCATGRAFMADFDSDIKW